MEGLLDLLSQPWATRALLASLMVGLMCGVLGVFIVLRNMALIGDALAHAILPGIVVAFMVFGNLSLGFFFGAVLAGILTALAITWIQRKVKTKNDAAIGIVFTLMFSLGVIGISSISRRDGVHLDLKDFLFGNVLGVSDADLMLTAGVAVVVLSSIILFYRQLFVTTFQESVAAVMGFSTQGIHYFIMLLLSIAVVASLRTVGVILVVAMLITPASTALLLSSRLKQVLLLSASIGILSSWLGFLAAVVFNTTPGPAMAVTATIFYVLAAFLSPSKGLISKWIKRRQTQLKILREDILKETFKQKQNSAVDALWLSSKLGRSKFVVQKHAQVLSQKGYLNQSADGIILTNSGEKIARRLLRAHRLWETYLVNKVGLQDTQIHEAAEKLEHHLSDEILDEVDAQLGYPTSDPHGSHIPAPLGFVDETVLDIPLNQTFQISKAGQLQWVEAELWERGLLGDRDLQILEMGHQNLVLSQDQRQVIIPKKLARFIRVQPDLQIDE